MMPVRASRWTWQPCVIAALAIAVAAGVRVVLLGELGRSTPYVTFFPALMIGAMVGGLRTGLLSTAVIAGLVFFWIQRATFAPSEATALVVFLLSGCLVSVIGEMMLRNRRRLEAADTADAQRAEALRLANEDLQRQVAERAHAEAELRRSEEMMELALTTADITAFTQDRSLRYTWMFNPQLAFTIAGVLGKSDAELLPPADLGALEAVKRRVLDSGEAIREEVRISASGRPRYYLLHAKPLRDSAGSITGLSGLAVDITERRETEQSQRESDARYRGIFENEHTVILVIDPQDGAIVDANPAATAFYGWAREKICGKKIGEINLLPPVELQEQMNRTVRREAGHFMFRHRLADGSVRDVEVFSGPIALEGRTLLLSFVRDITERKVAEERARAAQAETALLLAEGRISRLALLSVVEDQRKAQEALRQSEESLRQFNLELEQRVLERTAELEAANQELEAFNYSVSHDLRAPLRAIDGFARILQEDFAAQLGDEGRRVLGIIVKEEQRMEALVNDLLRLSRLGRQALVRHAVDMRELATLVAEPMLAQAGSRVVHLEVADLPTAWADASLIRQVLTNLLDNAFKFTHQRPVADITVGGSRQEGETVYFVADNGVGFDMSRRDRLFGVFQRLHSDEVYKGTGVGLALVKRIVLRHGGRVWAESRVGEGAKFHFSLPVALTPLPKPVSLRTSASPFHPRPARAGLPPAE